MDDSTAVASTRVTNADRITQTLLPPFGSLCSSKSWPVLVITVGRGQTCALVARSFLGRDRGRNYRRSPSCHIVACIKRQNGLPAQQITVRFRFRTFVKDCVRAGGGALLNTLAMKLKIHAIHSNSLVTFVVLPSYEVHSVFHHIAPSTTLVRPLTGACAYRNWELLLAVQRRMRPACMNGCTSMGRSNLTGSHRSAQMLIEHLMRTRREPSKRNTFIVVLNPSGISITGVLIN